MFWDVNVPFTAQDHLRMCDWRGGGGGRVREKETERDERKER